MQRGLPYIHGAIKLFFRPLDTCTPGGTSRSRRRNLTDYLLRVQELSGMPQDGAQSLHAQASAHSPAASPAHPSGESEYPIQLTKADLEDSLAAMYSKLAEKFLTELFKSTNTLQQELAALGGRTDLLETKHDQLQLAYTDPRRDHETFTDSVSQRQAYLEDLDNRNRRNNLRVRGVPEAVTDLIPAAQKLFQSLLPDSPVAAFSCDRIHRAHRPKPPDHKPPRDIVLCLKDYLTGPTATPPTFFLMGSRFRYTLIFLPPRLISGAR